MLRQCPSSVLGVGLALVLGSALAACTSSDSGGPTSGGGTAGTTGGASSGTEGGSSASGSTTSGASGGSTGSSSTGSGGACPPATKDASAPMPTAPMCTGNVPSAALITDFAGGNVAFSAFGMGPIAGGTYAYPGCSDTIGVAQPMFPLTSDFSGGNWHITGTVGTYSGFGVYWSCAVPDGGMYAYTGCSLDASTYSGVQFDIMGNAGPTGKVTFSIASANESAISSDPNNPNCNSCDSEAGACKGGSVPVTVGATSTTVTVKWTDLTGVMPDFDPAHLVPFQWSLDYSGTNFPVDLTIDNIKFVP